MDAVLAEARKIAKEGGIEHLTMRRLAESLGVAPNTLYSYFPDKSALLDTLMDSLLATVHAPAVPPADWRTGLMELMRSTRRFLLSQADLIPLFLARPRRGPNAIRLGEETLALLSEGGVEGQDAVEALRILLIYTFGFAAQEAPRRADVEPEARRSRNQRAFAAARDRPRMRDLAGPLSEHPGEETFELGLEWLLDGIWREHEVVAP
jgi:TetR/AcrR family transcriptional regulator, tetracycline repressor protein